MTNTAPTIILTDSNILLTVTLRNLILDTDYELGLPSVRWSPHILAEVKKHAPHRHNLTKEQANNLVRSLDRNFPDATVHPTDKVVATLSKYPWPDPDDIEVVAAALQTRAAYIITDNTAHFPTELLTKVGQQRLSSDELLTRLGESHPAPINYLLDMHAARSSQSDLVGSLVRAGAHNFAAQIARRWGIPAGQDILTRPQDGLGHRRVFVRPYIKRDGTSVSGYQR